MEVDGEHYLLYISIYVHGCLYPLYSLHAFLQNFVVLSYVTRYIITPLVDSIYTRALEKLHRIEA